MNSGHVTGCVPSTKPARRIPRATYRLQFNEHFRLRDALALVPYLSELGVSHVYASPLFAACPHSAHGYDVCDFSRLNPELGTEAELREFVSALRACGMGLVLDIVPNHMGIDSPQNRWWWNVLTYGPAGEYAGFFDIDWESPNPGLRGKVLAPVLDDRYERVLERGEIRLVEEAGQYVLRYFEVRLPITPLSLPARLIRDPLRPPIPASALAELNADPEALNELIGKQYYLPADWRDADRDLNYRRFFNVPTLAGLRMEDERVFHETHALIKQWLENGWVDGLRVDHPDGLRDPEEYLRRLRGLAPEAWIVVEKILEPGEELPTAWPVAGTTGYDFLNRAGGLFVDPQGEQPLTDLYREFTGEPVDFAAVALEQKRVVLRELLATEVTRLTELLVRIAKSEERMRNFPRDQFRESVTELAANLPVYRTYLRPEHPPVGNADLVVIEQTLLRARQRRPDLDPELFHFLGRLLLLFRPGRLETDFVLRFQQLTGAAMAKAVEDTAFYQFNRLVALNEVGGDPGRFGLSMESFHQACQVGQQHWPDTMLTTSTHDTKRSEDVRARLYLLSEIPGAWSAAVRRWSAMNRRHHRHDWPNRNLEYLLYQTLIGAWPVSEERLQAYLEKAARESRQHTTGRNPNREYEAALRDFVASVLADEKFRKDLELFVAPLKEPGHLNSLAQTLLKLTAPGVPDIYQGCELWDFSLVDPDNRRPVDFALRQRLLAGLKALPVEEVWRRRDEGLPKLWLIQRVLALRAQRPNLLVGSSSYEAISARGAKAKHAVSFMRGHGAITVVPRLVLGLAQDWADTTLEIPRGEWRNELTGENVESGPVLLEQLLRRFPVALLARKENA